MAILDFPPLSNGATYTQNEIDYLYDGTKWVASLGPSSGSQITTPYITYPLDGATNINPSVSLIITSSPFEGTKAGDHGSSSWEVVRGQQPLRSSQAITAVTNDDSNWTQFQVDNSLTAGRVQWMCQNPSNTDQILAVVAITDTGPCRAYYSSDNGANWTQGPQIFDTSSCILATPYFRQTDIPSSISTSSTPQFQAYQFEGGVILWGRNDNYSTNVSAWNTWTRIANGDSWTNFTNSTATSRFAGPGAVWPKPGAPQIVQRYAGSGSSGGWVNYILRDPLNNPTAAPVTFTPPVIPSGYNAIGSNPYFIASDVANGITIIGAGENGNTFLARRTDGFNGNLEDGNWVRVLDPGVEYDSVFGYGNAVYNLIFDDELNLFILLNKAGLFTSPDGLEWTPIPTPMLVSPPAYLTKRDGIYAITSIDVNSMMFTSNFEPGSFSSLVHAGNTDPYAAITFIGVDGQWGAQFPATLDSDGTPHTNHCSLATIPADQTILTINDCVDDGFTIKRRVMQFDSAEEASGVVYEVTNTSMTIFPTQGTWEVGAKVMTSGGNTVIIVDSQDDSNNLTSLTLDSSDLITNTDYYVRVQYRSTSNVTSYESDWSYFRTTS